MHAVISKKHSRDNFLRNRGDDGQALVEYALILGLVTLATVATLGLLGTSVNNAINAVIAGF